MRQRTTLLLLSALTGAVLSLGAACGGSTTSSGGGDTALDPALADVVYEGGASQKALKSLLAKTPVDDPQKGVEIDNPVDKTLLPPTPIPTFSWHLRGPTARREPVLLPLPGEPRAKEGLARFLGPLRELLGGEREAFAQEAPMQGDGYFLVFSTDMDPKVLRVFTTKTSYTPDAKAWEKLTSLEIWTTLTILTGGFSNDALSANGGPYKGSSVAFCIER